MNWSIYVCFLVFSLSAYCEAGALRCPPGALDPTCTEEKSEVDVPESPDSAPPEVQCLIGTEWESNCHYCRCSDSGIAECLKQDVCDKGIFAEPAQCKPNTTFQRDCNTCVCLDNGLGLCTLEFCRKSYKPVETLELLEESDSKKEITENAESVDSVIPITKSSINATKPQVCVAKRMFVKDCNTCWCNDDGTSYFCTRKVCVPLLPDEEPDLGGIPAEDLRVTKKKCQPNEVFEIDCNMCRCNPDGMSYACTRRACEETEEKEKITLSRKVRSFTTSDTQKACQPGQEFRLDCNQCLCDNRGLAFSCTRNDCSSLNNHHASKRDVTEHIVSKCQPGSVFDRDCNACRCTEDGNHAVCSIKSCKQKNEIESDVDIDDPGFRCNPGEQFKRDCKDCTCSADGKSVFCTLRLCDEDLTGDMEPHSN